MARLPRPADPLLLGWFHRDEATLKQLATAATEHHRSVPELLVQRLRQARATQAPSWYLPTC